MFGEQSCVYDALGNPTTYRDNALKWQRLRNLVSHSNNGNEVRFTYNANNLRTAKWSSLNTSRFIWNNGLLLAETRDFGVRLPQTLPFHLSPAGRRDVIEYLYGVDGIAGFTLNGKAHYFRKNPQGDITHIFAADKTTLLARYRYNAWGEHKVFNPNGTENTEPNFIGNINAIRYRGYYYDVETKLYYLKTRYYDPEVGRFINMDDPSYSEPSVFNGLNLYAYCGNNPVMYYDPTGRSLIALFIGAIVGAVAAGIAIGVTGGSVIPDFSLPMFTGQTGRSPNRVNNPVGTVDIPMSNPHIGDAIADFFVSNVYRGFIRPVFVTGDFWRNSVGWLNDNFWRTLEILSGTAFDAGVYILPFSPKVGSALILVGLLGFVIRLF